MNIFAIRSARDMIPQWPGWLWRYIRAFYGYEIPYKAVCTELGHCAPFSYVVGSYFETTEGWRDWEKSLYSPHRDCIVHANRYGGKTQDGAILSHLNCVHLKRCEVRLLGGSSEQSKRMQSHKNDCDANFMDMVVGEPGIEKTRYTTGSSVEIMTGSTLSVRGPHPQKLRLDEVDEFKEEVHRAVKLLPMTKKGIAASLEQLSTVHRPFGIMNSELLRARAAGGLTRVYTWCIFECLQECTEPCSPEAPNPACLNLTKYDQTGQRHTLYEVCHGKAKRARGYFAIDDFRAAFERSGWEDFMAEMLCRNPKRSGMIYSALSQQEAEEIYLLSAPFYRADWPLFMALDEGHNNPHALWFQVSPEGIFVWVYELTGSDTNGYDFAEKCAKVHEERGYRLMEAGFADPSRPDFYGEFNRAGRRERMFRSDMPYSRYHGVMMASDPSMLEGYEQVRRLLELRESIMGAEPEPRLYFSPECPVLWEQMVQLHEEINKSTGEEKGKQVKVNDHGADALRYGVMGYYWWKPKVDSMLERRDVRREGEGAAESVRRSA